MPFARIAAVAGFLILVPVVVLSAAENYNEANQKARQFVAYYEATIRPLEIDANKLFWTANLTGKETDFARKQAAEEKLNVTLADATKFSELKAIKDAGPTDPMLKRQIDVLYLIYLERQVPPELLKKITAKSNAVERTFNVFRPKVGGKQITDNDVRRVLLESHDTAERKAYWDASKEVGRVVVADLKSVVKMRNEAARKLGFKNYHSLRLYLSEQNEEQLAKLFDELDELTRKPFHAAKAKMDADLAKNCGIKTEELRPWHYHDPFFQEAPTARNELPEAIYQKIDPLKMCRDFYAGIGLPIDDVLDRSDLYEKPGKNPHAFSTDIDRAGDVRILENVKPNRAWLCTTLHELGHATYSKHISRSLPYVLRSDAHPLCTEGIAIMFERFGLNVVWLGAMGADAPADAASCRAVAQVQRNQLLVFARYCQVMYRFERELYANPDQDLNKLWWDLIEKYQELKRPEGRDAPDFAAKYHFVGAPVYYHNYMMGEMFASQVHHKVMREVVAVTGKTPLNAMFFVYVTRSGVGDFFRTHIFEPGMMMPWNELTRHATGEPLNAKAFAEDLGAK